MPMDRRRYPPDWESIAFGVKQRANWVCEVCGKPCRRPGEKFDTHKRTLTVAHINHTPEDCDENNLVAACAPCHLDYDRPMKILRRIVKKRLEVLK
jgi:5-methylcytosine-specific restriction endonuclease McrA